jgi:hypothetical protein
MDKVALCQALLRVSNMQSDYCEVRIAFLGVLYEAQEGSFIWTSGLSIRL